MTRADPAATPREVNDWKPTQETPSLLLFTGGRLAVKTEEELSELLTRKFREFFP